MLVYAGGEAWISVTSTEMTQNNSEISFKRLPWPTALDIDQKSKCPILVNLRFMMGHEFHE